ncbi:MAG TPA: pyruvate kinase [Gemmatimonadaceae bacterium]|nr:pyruvate kinase [Gemmatimonadaceae bacterium]
MSLHRPAVPNHHNRRTKIVCTLGPASSSREQLRGLMEAGLNVARLNFSHGTHEQHLTLIETVRGVAKELGCPVASLGDLQGPRIRVGDLAAPIKLVEGSDVVLVHEDTARGSEIPVTYEGLPRDVHVGDRILLDDGLLELMVLDVKDGRVTGRVVHGGPLKSHKGMNLPGIDVSAPSITDKDEADIEFAARQGLEYLALSFVRRAADIASLRRKIPREMLICAKIELDIALKNIESVAAETDAIMVARGDLGVELPFEEVPLAQKRIIQVANRLGKPVITATQMLESMVTHPRPTRAEASDVANAIIDGTGAVMLSAETAAGAFPRLAVEAMTRIITEVETHAHPVAALSAESPVEEEIRGDGRTKTEDAIAAATAAAAEMVGAPCVVVFTKSGFTARVVSSFRPTVPILTLTDSERTYRQLALVWGVLPELVPHCDTYEEMVLHALEAVRRRGLATTGDRVIVTAGVPFDTPGATNMLKVEKV